LSSAMAAVSERRRISGNRFMALRSYIHMVQKAKVISKAIGL